MHCRVDKSPEVSGSPFSFVGADEDQESQAAWYVAYTESRLEQLASSNLQQQGFLTYLPMYRGNPKRLLKSRATTPGKAAAGLEPMFPRYLFFKPASPKQSISSVRSTRGVTAVVRFGSYFAQVQPETLAAMRRHEELSARQDPLDGMLPQPGSRVKLLDPALSGLEGLVDSVSTRRVIVLMEILGQQTRVRLRPHQLEPS